MNKYDMHVNQSWIDLQWPVNPEMCPLDTDVPLLYDGHRYDFWIRHVKLIWD